MTTTITLYSAAVKVDMSKSIKLASSQKPGYTMDQIVKMASLANYLRSK